MRMGRCGCRYRTCHADARGGGPFTHARSRTCLGNAVVKQESIFNSIVVQGFVGKVLAQASTRSCT